MAVNLTSGEQLTGRIGAVEDTRVSLDIAGTPREIEFAEVSKALVQVEFNRPAELAEAEED